MFYFSPYVSILVGAGCLEFYKILVKWPNGLKIKNKVHADLALFLVIFSFVCPLIPPPYTHAANFYDSMYERKFYDAGSITKEIYETGKWMEKNIEAEERVMLIFSDNFRYAYSTSQWLKAISLRKIVLEKIEPNTLISIEFLKERNLDFQYIVFQPVFKRTYYYTQTTQINVTLCEGIHFDNSFEVIYQNEGIFVYRVNIP